MDVTKMTNVTSELRITFKTGVAKRANAFGIKRSRECIISH